MRGVIPAVNPLVLLSIGVVAFFQSFFIRDVVTALCALALWLLLAALFLPTWRYPLVALFVATLSAAMVSYSTWRSGVHDPNVLAAACIRIVILAWPGSAVLAYLNMARLGDYLAQSLKLPARSVAAVGVGLQRFDQLAVVFSDASRARRVRGLAPSFGSPRWISQMGQLAFVVLVAALRGAMWSAIAMDGRGFATASSRTWAEPAVWTRRDKIALGTLIVVAAGALVLGGWLGSRPPG
jgi:energy-coupling factor transport system permease protein